MQRTTSPSLPSDDGTASLTDGSYNCANMGLHPGLPTTSAGADRSPSGSCWVAPSDHHDHNIPPYFRLFSEESAGYGDLLQQAAGEEFDHVLSSGLPGDAHIRSGEDGFNHQFVASTARYNCYSTSTTTDNTVNNMPDNLLSSTEFMPPSAAAAARSRQISSSNTILTFQNNMSKLSAPALSEIHPSDSSDTYMGARRPSDGLQDEANVEKQEAAEKTKRTPPQKSEENAANKKVKNAVDQSIAATDSAQFQAINKAQSARSKEKLGERINALQQLVSPFGKTDTASVLSEAIGYIKFLQEQVQVLSSPYMKPMATINNNRQEGESASDLRSRGLCLVPVSCTLNVANNNGADYWASSVGGHSRYSASSS